MNTLTYSELVNEKGDYYAKCVPEKSGEEVLTMVEVDLSKFDIENFKLHPDVHFSYE